MCWEHISTLSWSSWNNVKASWSHIRTRKRIYGVWGVRYQITHGSCRYSLFSITPHDIQEGRISLWVSSPGVSSIFFLCAKVFRGVFHCRLRDLGFIINCCSCVQVNPSDTFYVTLGYAKIKRQQCHFCRNKTKHFGCSWGSEMRSDPGVVPMGRFSAKNIEQLIK